MANEVTSTDTFSYADAAGVEMELDTTSFTSSPSALKPSTTKQNILTSETAIKLGDTTAPGEVKLVNLDPTNYVDVKVAASGAIFARLLPNGGFARLYLGSGAQAPVAVANTAPCLIQVMIVPA